MDSAVSIICATSVTFQGLTNTAPAPSDCAAPANSERISTPGFKPGKGGRSFPGAKKWRRRVIARGQALAEGGLMKQGGKTQKEEVTILGEVHKYVGVALGDAGYCGYLLMQDGVGRVVWVPMGIIFSPVT